MKTKNFLHYRDMRFRRFTNRPYALFACMNVRVSIGVLAVEMLSVASTGTVSAQVEHHAKGQQYELKEIVVTASRVPMSLDEVARPVEVLDSAAISEIPAQNINDLLKYLSGVDVRQRGPMGVQTDMSIRGGTFDQVAVLLNGINICDAHTGHNVGELPVDISEIERIEVLRGPAGRAYGVSSLVGAINIITRIADANSADIHAGGGSYGWMEGGGRASFTQSRWGQQLSGGYERSDGYSRNKAGRLNANFQRGRLFYQGKFDDEAVKVRWHFGFADKDYGANTFYSTLSDDQFEHVRKYQLALQAETGGKRWHFRPSAYWNRSEDRFEFFKDRPDLSPYNHHRLDVLGVSLNQDFTTVLGTTAIGAEFRNEGIVSTQLGELLRYPIGISGSDAEYIYGLNRTHLSFHLDHFLHLGKWSLSAGVLTVKNTGSEMNFRFYPGVDIGFDATKWLKFIASYNTSLRMPTFTELYYSVNGHKADRFLQPEEMEAVELGWKVRTVPVDVEMNGFYHHGTNMIDWIKDFTDGEEAPWQSVNHTELTTWGVETAVTLHPSRMFGDHCRWKSLRLTYAFQHQDKQREAHIQSKYALEYLRNKLTVQSGFRIWKSLEMDLTGRWNDRVGNYQVGTELRSYTPYVLIDSRLSWNEPSYRIFVEGNNLLNRRYYDYGNVPQPGIWVKAGFNWTLHY